jgi:Cu-Zn family superoxide dismutase
VRSPSFAIAVLIVAAACSRSMSAGGDPNASLSLPTGSVVASLRDASGNDLGTLTVAQAGAGLAITGTLHGLTPGAHGIHIHSVGRCEPPFATAGGHWNPQMRQHGMENPSGPHAGDMQNIVVGNDGTAAVSVTTATGTLRDATGLLDADGAAIVVHAAADDYKTDPSGNSGARVACGVVLVRKIDSLSRP